MKPFQATLIGVVYALYFVSFIIGVFEQNWWWFIVPFSLHLLFLFVGRVFVPSSTTWLLWPNLGVGVTGLMVVSDISVLIMLVFALIESHPQNPSQGTLQGAAAVGMISCVVCFYKTCEIYERSNALQHSSTVALARQHPILFPI